MAEVFTQGNALEYLQAISEWLCQDGSSLVVLRRSSFDHFRNLKSLIQIFLMTSCLNMFKTTSEDEDRAYWNWWEQPVPQTQRLGHQCTLESCSMSLRVSSISNHSMIL